MSQVLADILGAIHGGIHQKLPGILAFYSKMRLFSACGWDEGII